MLYLWLTGGYGRMGWGKNDRLHKLSLSFLYHRFQCSVYLIQGRNMSKKDGFPWLLMFLKPLYSFCFQSKF